MSITLNTLAEQLSFKVFDETAYGTVGGIFYNIYEDLSSFFLYGFVKREQGIDTKEINEFLNAHKNQLKIRRSFKDNDIVKIYLNPQMREAQNMSTFLEAFSKFLTENGYHSGCAFCDKPDDLRLIANDDRVMQTCRACEGKFADKLSVQKHERETSGSYLKGTIGAILGGVLGVIPFLFTELDSMYSGALISLLVYEGYKLIGGRRSRKMLPIIITAIFFFSSLAIIAGSCVSSFMHYDDLSALEALSRFVSAPFDNFIFQGGIWMVLPFGWLFSFTGSAVILLLAEKQSSHRDLELKKVE